MYRFNFAKFPFLLFILGSTEDSERFFSLSVLSSPLSLPFLRADGGRGGCRALAFRVEFDLYCPHHIMGNRWAEHIHSSSTYQDHLQPTRTTSSSPGQSPNHQDHLPPTNTHPWLYFRLSVLWFALLTGALGMNHPLPGEHQPWMRAASTA